MDYKWAFYLGRKVFEICKAHMTRPMQLLSVFEDAGKRADKAGEFLEWRVPGTNFLVVQHYTEGTVKKVWVPYGPPIKRSATTGHMDNELQINICFMEEQIPSKGRQAQGAAPNIIHSLDAAHLVMTANKCSFPITTVHDSFGSLLADMPELYKNVREAFVELYELNPLDDIMQQIGGDPSGILIGNLNLREVLSSEFCFA